MTKFQSNLYKLKYFGNQVGWHGQTTETSANPVSLIKNYCCIILDVLYNYLIVKIKYQKKYIFYQYICETTWYKWEKQEWERVKIILIDISIRRPSSPYPGSSLLCLTKWSTLNFPAEFMVDRSLFTLHMYNRKRFKTNPDFLDF